jgi:hypothetical protein
MILIVALATGVLFAQGQGGGPGAGGPGGGMGMGFRGMGMGAFGGTTTMVKTDKGLFVLRAGVLAEFDLTTLQKVQEMQLFGPAPERPTDMTDQVAMTKYVTDMARRAAPGVLLVKGDSLLLVIGDNFAKISQRTLKVEASASLAAPSAETDAAAGPQIEGAPGTLLVDNTLYLMRSKEILAISVTDGKILTRSILPKELQPAQGGGMGGRAFGGGGGGRGNRGNRGGGQGQDQNPPAN